jgi:hypothetical protein
MSNFLEKIAITIFIVIAVIFFVDQSIITSSELKEEPKTDGEFFISVMKSQREGNYQILRDTYNKETFSDKTVKLIAKCSEEKLFTFINTTEDYDTPLPRFKSQEDMNNHFISIIKRKVQNSEITLEWYLGVADSQCLDEVMEGVYE